MRRVTGIGGIFFKSDNPQPLYEWYERHLGIQREAHGQGASFEWRELRDEDGQEPGAKAQTAWSIFPRGTKYFGASKADFMVNYRGRRSGWAARRAETSGRGNRSAPRGL